MKASTNKPTDKLGKFLLLSLMMAMQIYVLHILKNAKDTIIITQIGAEIISTLELFGILPSIVIFSLIYTKLTDRLTITQIFYTLNCIFAIFFLAFAFFIYPNAKVLHFDFSELVTALPWLKYPLLMVANWSYSLFYVMAELWGTVMLSLMFWLIANQINSVDEAKKYYPLFSLTGEFGLILSGAIMTVFTLTSVASNWGITLNYICGSVFIMIIFINIAFYCLTRLVSSDEINKPYAKVEVKLTLKESIYHVLNSKLIRLIALMLFCYGVSINLSETLWKKQLSILYPHSLDYGHFLAKVQILIGIITLAAIILSSFVLRKLSWYRAALITPIIFILTSLPFFICIFLSEGIFSINFAYLALFISVLFGSAQHIFAKAMKYSFFEPTKEMLYIPLSEELKTKGKGVADLLGERFGKSFGSVVQLGLLSVITGSTLLSFAPVLFMVFLFFIITWLYSLQAINRELKSHA